MRARQKKEAKKATSLYPWVPFLVFFLSSVFLSYASLPLQVKFWIFLAGIAIPFWVVLRVKTTPNPDPFSTETFSSPKPFVWLLLLAAAIYMRFYHLGSLSVWPVLDESRNAYFSMELSRHWDWRFFRDISQMPPLSYWVEGLFFKVFTPSLYNLWLLPALLSLALIPAGYFGARRFLSQSLSFLFACLLSVGFYSVYVGRFNHQAIQLVLWEMVTFWFLGTFLKAQKGSQELWAFLLGLAVGVGFYIYFSWPFVALAVGAVIALSCWKKKRRVMVIFLGALGFSLLPLVVAAIREGYGSYLLSLKPGGEGSLVEWLPNSLSYLSAFFWGLDTDRHAYKPFWGGYLNPILDACFFIGFLELLKNRGTAMAKALLGMFFLMVLPAFISKEIQLFRVVQVLPILLIIAGLGIQTILIGTSSKLRLLLLAGLLTFSTGIDFYHLAGPYHEACSTQFDRWAGYSKSVERWRAYQTLKETSAQGGICLLSNFDPYPFDRGLEVAAAPFDLLNQPDSLGKAQWLAFMANVNYRPFLAREFPGAKFYWEAEDLYTLDGGLMLVVLPMEGQNNRLVRWITTDSDLKTVTLEMLNRPMGSSREGILRDMEALHASCQGDPFLESLYWNLAYLNHIADMRFKEAQGDLEMAIQKGYPTAYFYNELGSLFLRNYDYRKAREALLKAVHCELNETPAGDNLKAMDDLDGAGNRPVKK